MRNAMYIHTRAGELAEEAVIFQAGSVAQSGAIHNETV